MKKITLISLFLLFTTSLWAAKAPVVLKMVDGTERKGEVNPPKIDDKTLKFFPADGGKSIDIPSNTVATMVMLSDDGLSGTEYDYVPVLNVVDTYKQRPEKRIANYLWLVAERRGYMTLYHSRSSSTSMSFGSHGMSTSTVGWTNKYCRRAGENGATIVITTGTFNSNNVFKGYAKRYFTDDEQILGKIENGEYTYKEIDAVVEEYNSRHSAAQ